MSINQIDETKWAIMVCLDGNDDWIFITEDTNRCWDLQVMLFDDINDALEQAKVFTVPGKENNVQVVNYDEKMLD